MIIGLRGKADALERCQAETKQDQGPGGWGVKKASTRQDLGKTEWFGAFEPSTLPSERVRRGVSRTVES